MVMDMAVLVVVFGKGFTCPAISRATNRLLLREVSPIVNRTLHVPSDETAMHKHLEWLVLLEVGGLACLLGFLKLLAISDYWFIGQGNRVHCSTHIPVTFQDMLLGDRAGFRKSPCLK